MTDLLALNKQGLFPGPDEDLPTFLARLKRIRNLTHSSIPPSDWATATHLTTTLYDINPTWLIAFYSNTNLPPWQGAATWIDNSIPLIQLKTTFARGSYLGYSRDEILAHEAVHAARMAFHEPRFEELLAYRTSRSRLRRFLGPLFRTPTESTLFLSTLLLSLAATITNIFFSSHILTLISLLPILALTLLLIRLIHTHTLFNRCLKNLSRLTPHPLAVALRLTDREIISFARNTPIPTTSLRWQVITAAYAMTI
jgi:hypothetical protein